MLCRDEQSLTVDEIVVQDTRAADPRKRMRMFFETLYACLARGARAVLQIYPEDANQVRNPPFGFIP
jgi:hypothetical protein